MFQLTSSNWVLILSLASPTVTLIMSSSCYWFQPKGRLQRHRQTKLLARGFFTLLWFRQDDGPDISPDQVCRAHRQLYFVKSCLNGHS
ncbi:hypothetical protein BDQ17DRAFT_1354353 [Cyathus striatus]|nr:hypothetical protein BDQ17DRAFT_1354353 [Cyathus striatus]